MKTIADINNLPDIEVSEIETTESYTLTVKYFDKVVFQKGKICCPFENKRNVKELILAHCYKELIDLKIIKN